ncbi:NAD-dependent deacylase [Roseiterribacter gracilis]|uniref:NAD-dependent protein deacylase n=1 Tax=Roseiterribacter gracilis TaxID=2812848 RepID=A0A8S8X8T0_9PROT|nr:NAD-dependent protein deacylase [Rhodospirillales bacterium TMPK1]
MKIVVLTGAGVSAESGLATFRDAGGIWARYRIEDVATPDAYARNPAKVLDFYTQRRVQLRDPAIDANDTHRALARLAASGTHEVLLVTQNVDDLHERGGSEDVLHMHGELFKTRCLACDALFDDRDDLTLQRACAACGASGRLRPHVVWFGEMPLELDRVYDALTDSDLFVSIGTSGNVYPAADFVRTARSAGARTLELNLEPSEGASLFHDARYGPASNLVPAWVDEILA